ncbi:ATP-grasp domain-containing protein [Planctomycetota bacterium]|nr:ATP-grasp domain-containing protein [Planctomycetota bacterium]
MNLRSPDPDHHVSLGSVRLEQRLHELVALAPALDLELDVLSSDALGTPGAHAALRQADGVWWTGGMAFLPTMEPMWTRLRSDLAAVQRDVPAIEAPQVVEEVDNLGIYFPMLAAAGIDQPATQLLPLSPDQERLPESDLRAHLDPRVANVEFPAEGLFFRTYYGTRKQLFALNVATDSAELAEGLTDMIVALRDVQGQSIGGLALRELVPIERVRDLASGREIAREFRMFVVCGVPVYWNLHCDLAQLSQWVEPETLTRAGSPTSAQVEQMVALSRQVADLVRSRFFTVDFVLRPDGQPVLIELNAGYCAGWGPRIAYVAVFGQLLRRLVGLPLLEPDAVLRLGAEADLVDWSPGGVWGWP